MIFGDKSFRSLKMELAELLNGWLIRKKRKHTTIH